MEDIVKKSEEAKPEENVSEEVVAEEAVERDTVPEEAISEDTASEEVVSEEVASEEVTSEEVISEEVFSKKIISEVAKSEEILYEDAKPDVIRKKNDKRIRWYHKRWVRITAGFLAVVMLVFTIAYALLRSKYTSLYSELSGSEDTLKDMSKASSGHIANKDEYEFLIKYTGLLDQLNSGDNKKAIETAREILDTEGDIALKSALEELLCQMYYTEEMYKDAIATSTHIINSNNNPGGIPYYVRGMSEIQLEEYSKASEDLKQALESGALDKESVYLQLAICSYSDKQFEDSVLYSEKYLEIPKAVSEDNPNKDKISGQYVSNDNLCRYIAAVSYMNREDFDKSKSYFDELLGIEEDSELYYFRGVDNMALEDYEAAADDFSRAKEMGKDETEVCYDLGICLLSIGKISEGTDELYDVIEKNDRPELTTASKNILTAIMQEQ